MELVRGWLPRGFTGEIKDSFGLGLRPGFAAGFEPLSYLLEKSMSTCPQETKDKGDLHFVGGCL